MCVVALVRAAGNDTSSSVEDVIVQDDDLQVAPSKGGSRGRNRGYGGYYGGYYSGYNNPAYYYGGYPGYRPYPYHGYGGYYNRPYG